LFRFAAYSKYFVVGPAGVLGNLSTNVLNHGRQPEIDPYHYWLVLAPHQSLENSDLFWCLVACHTGLIGFKRETLNFWLAFVVQERLC